MALILDSLTPIETAFVNNIQPLLTITDPNELAQLLGQIKQESGFRPIEERLAYSAEELLKSFPNRFTDLQDAGTVCCGKDRQGLASRLYDNRKDLGNNQPGDGFKYRGRGYIQLTGKANYTSFGNRLGLDLVNNPDLVNTPDVAAKITALFWQDRVRNNKNVNGNYSDTTAVTKAINGGTIGLPNRQSNFDTYFKKITGQDSLIQQPALTDDYIGNTYVKTMDASGVNKDLIDPASKSLTAGSITGPSGKRLIDILKDGTQTLSSPLQLDNDKLLLMDVGKINQAYDNEANAISNAALQNASPADAYNLINLELFEFQPDLMRQLLASNAGDGSNAEYSHAWRAPGKLAVTANVTIPGASGFKIGQVFWIGRTYERYKQNGVFQLFGLTETISLNRGWTTELYARLNVIPKTKIINLKST